MHNVYEVHTWICSIPDCGEQLTGYGEDHATMQGWETTKLFNEEMDLCPGHVRDLKEYLFDEPLS